MGFLNLLKRMAYSNPAYRVNDSFRYGDTTQKPTPAPGESLIYSVLWYDYIDGSLEIQSPRRWGRKGFRDFRSNGEWGVVGNAICFTREVGSEKSPLGVVNYRYCLSSENRVIRGRLQLTQGGFE